MDPIIRLLVGSFALVVGTVLGLVVGLGAALTLDALEVVDFDGPGELVSYTAIVEPDGQPMLEIIDVPGSRSLHDVAVKYIKHQRQQEDESVPPPPGAFDELAALYVNEGYVTMRDREYNELAADRVIVGAVSALFGLLVCWFTTRGVWRFAYANSKTSAADSRSV